VALFTILSWAVVLITAIVIVGWAGVSGRDGGGTFHIAALGWAIVILTVIIIGAGES